MRHNNESKPCAAHAPHLAHTYRHQRRVLLGRIGDGGRRRRTAAIVVSAAVEAAIGSGLGEAHLGGGALMVGQMVVVDDGLHLQMRNGFEDRHRYEWFVCAVVK